MYYSFIVPGGIQLSAFNTSGLGRPELDEILTSYVTKDSLQQHMVELDAEFRTLKVTIQERLKNLSTSPAPVQYEHIHVPMEGSLLPHINLGKNAPKAMISTQSITVPSTSNRPGSAGRSYVIRIHSFV